MILGLLLFSLTCIVGFFDLFLVFLDLIEIRFGCWIFFFFENDLVAGFRFGVCHILVWVRDGKMNPTCGYPAWPDPKTRLV